jgi:hypothetical protein
LVGSLVPELIVRSIIGTQAKNTFKQNKKQLHISATSRLDLNHIEGETRDKLPISQIVSCSMSMPIFWRGNYYCNEV